MAKLTRSDKKQIEAILARYKTNDRTTMSAQDSIPFQQMYPDGICRVTDNLYIGAFVIFGDVELTKAMGYNGARKHQKFEDPRYLYWADKLGLLVWGELPSAYWLRDSEKRNMMRDLSEAIKRDYNHRQQVIVGSVVMLCVAVAMGLMNNYNPKR